MRTQITNPVRSARKMELLSRLPISPWVFRDPLQFFEDLQSGREPIARMRIAGTKVFYLREPDLIREMLVTLVPNFHKSRGLERAKALLGEGLLTSEGELHRQQRKLIQPVFHHGNLKDIAVIMRERARQRAESWRAGQTLNLNQEMHALTLTIVGEALFGTEVGERTGRVSQLMETVMETFFLFMSPLASLFEFFGHPKLKRAAKARRELSAIVQTMIDERRKTNQTRKDLLTLLFAAQDPETGLGMSDEQLRDEVMTLFLAGHETTANALAWTIYLLTQHPDIAQRLAAEVRPVGMRSRLREPAPAMEMDKGPSSVGQACASPADDLESELGTKDDDLLSRVIRESLRLYPPVWAVGRRATQDLQIGGTEVPKGAIVLACQWALHRSDRYFSNPIQFDPDRWMSDDQRALPKYAFFPFGGGPRSCIGEGFAWMELRIVLTEILRRWRFEIVPGQTVKPKASITLRPERPIQVIVR
ncbi:MAG TPA: cytochrome P450 [Chthoniobacterales bacterium]